ncbi:MAG: ATPase [Legionellales bacterium]|nr:ATPase [Legionellales bacterium]
MNPTKFIGREEELATFNELLKKKTSTLMVIKGRRRIGKTSLIEKFAEGKPFLRFVGLAPVDGVTAQSQRDEFARLLAEQTDLPQIETDDWSQLFALLGQFVKQGRHIILFDEITWMAERDPTFLSKLKNAWELYYKQNPQLILVLCSSISAWVEEHILSSTGYFGRIAKKITLKELPLRCCNDLLDAVGFKRSVHEKFMMLSLTGGVPWYIELIEPKRSAFENINELCFNEDGILVDEHRYIFHDLFGKRSAVYEKITEYLANGAAEYSAIADGISYASSGTLTSYLSELIESGYVRQTMSWSIKTGKPTKTACYRLADNYLRFYYKYIQPKLDLIKNGQYKNIAIGSLPGMNSMLGFQFEALVINNADLLHQILHLRPEEITISSPYYQTATKQRQGCQIDYLIQTRLNTLFVCEIKFSSSPLTTKVIQEVEEKIKRMATPKNFTCVPILIHVNGVSDEVLDADYFYRIVDFADLLTTK